MLRRLSSLIIFIALAASALARAGELNRQKFLAPLPAAKGGLVRVAFFDADSTLRVANRNTPSANGPHDYNILPGVAETIKKLNAQGILVVIVSNQAGIPHYISLEDADGALFNMSQDLKTLGAIVNYYDFAENEDQYRKPDIGMAQRLEEKLRHELGPTISIDKAGSFMVGDSAYKKAMRGKPAERRPDGRPGFNFSNSDRLFAVNYGIGFYEPQDFFGWKQFGVEVIETKDQLEELKRRIGNLEMCAEVLKL